MEKQKTNQVVVGPPICILWGLAAHKILNRCLQVKIINIKVSITSQKQVRITEKKGNSLLVNAEKSKLLQVVTYS